MKNICVYIGANFGNIDNLDAAVEELGIEIAEQGLTLIYGGSSLGMMGKLAKAVKKHGGSVIGIITKHLISQEKPLNDLDELIVVDSMQDRKKKMQLLSDVFIVMPGGLGTLEEAIETWNAIKIGELKKQILFFNYKNYFEELMKFIDSCSKKGFIKEADIQIPILTDNIIKSLRKLNSSYKQDILEVLELKESGQETACKG